MMNIRFICVLCLMVFMLGSFNLANAQDDKSEATPQATAEKEIEAETQKDPCEAYKSDRAKLICRDRMKKIERMHELKAKRQARRAADREQWQTRNAPPAQERAAEEEPAEETPETEEDSEPAADSAGDKDPAAAAETGTEKSDKRN